MRLILVLLCTLLALHLPATGGQPPTGDAEPDTEPPKGRSIVITRPDADAEQISSFIPLRSLTWEEAKPFVTGMLSEDGTVGFLSSRNSIVIHDRRDVVEKVRNFVQAIDRDPVVVSITVEFTNDYMGESKRVGAVFDDDPEGPKVVIEDGNVTWPKKVEITGNQTTREGSRGTTQMISTLSGSPAEIWVGRQIPDPEWLADYTFRPVIIAPHSNIIIEYDLPPREWRDVGASLYVLPVYTDAGLVRVDLYPVVTYHDREGGRHSFRVEEVRTSVITEPGERIFIGGNDEVTQNFMRQLLGPELYNKSRHSNALGMWLTTRIRKVGGSEQRPQRQLY